MVDYGPCKLFPGELKMARKQEGFDNRRKREIQTEPAVYGKKFRKLSIEKERLRRDCKILRKKIKPLSFKTG
jgi:hypothetical protein